MNDLQYMKNPISLKLLYIDHCFSVSKQISVLNYPSFRIPGVLINFFFICLFCQTQTHWIGIDKKISHPRDQHFHLILHLNPSCIKFCKLQLGFQKKYNQNKFQNITNFFQNYISSFLYLLFLFFMNLSFSSSSKLHFSHFKFCINISLLLKVASS